MRWRDVLGLGLCGVVLVAAAFAQGFRGPGPGGFRGPGFGGPGFGDPLGVIGVIGLPEVQEELKLSEEQKPRVADALSKMHEQARSVFENINFPEVANLEDKEREQRFEKLRTQMEDVAKQTEGRLSKVLDETQAQRFAELQVQRGGIGSLLREDIGKKLKLTSNQRRKLREVVEQNPPFLASPEQRQKVEADAVAVLDDAQQGTWKKLRGAEFRFPEPSFGFGPGGFGPPPFGGPGGGPGGPMQQDRPLVKQFDKDEDGRLNNDERQAARESLKKDGGRRGGFGPPGFGPGGPGGRGGPPVREREPAKPGPQVSPADVTPVDAPLYDTHVLRTIFLDFENDDWETELSDFHGTDVEVPATLTVDGKKYPNVGIHFRGMSSYGMVPAGYKRSLNVSLDFVDSKQRLYGYKTLNLLNAHEDDSFMNTVLYSHIARQYMPAPKANFVKVVINGESWGVYVNVQQFNKEFLAENFPSAKGTRWKVSGSPMGAGGLEYLGENVEDYKRRYEMKTDDDKAWKKLIEFCRVLNQTPTEKLESALEPILDIDSLLWFLALDNALINCDGYWIRASDYSIFLDDKGKFHILPHDMNEAFRPAMGPGFGFGPGGPGGFGSPPIGPGRGGFGGPFGGPPSGRPNEARPNEPRGEDRRAGERRANAPRDDARGQGGPNVDLDPLIGLDDLRKPLRSKVLAVPSLRARYLKNVRTIAEKSLDWQNLGPVVVQLRDLIQDDVEADTRKLTSFAEFQKATADAPAKDATKAEQPRRFGPPHISLRAFADQRRQFLLNHEAVKSAK